MNSKQESRFSMYLATVAYGKENVSLTASLPNFNANITALETTCNSIHALAEEQAVDITGTSTLKSELREKVIAPSIDTCRKLLAYAKLTKNQKLEKEINFSESQLRHQSDAMLVDTAKMIYERAQTYLPQLGEYQITTETQAVLLQSISDFKEIMASPRLEQVNQVRATKQMAELFSSGDILLENMDAVVEIIRISQPNFYVGYKTARKVIEKGVGKLVVKGTVTDTQTGEPIPGVTVSFWLDGDPTKVFGANEPAILVKRTAEKGGFNIPSLPAGAYRTKLQKVGYAEQILTIYVNDGEMTTVDVQLSKV